MDVLIDVTEYAKKALEPVRTQSPIAAAKTGYREELMNLSQAYKWWLTRFKDSKAVLDVYVEQGKAVDADFVHQVINEQKLGVLAGVFSEAEQRREKWHPAQLMTPFLRGAIVRKSAK